MMEDSSRWAHGGRRGLEKSQDQVCLAVPPPAHTPAHTGSHPRQVFRQKGGGDGGAGNSESSLTLEKVLLPDFRKGRNQSWPGDEGHGRNFPSSAR